MDISGWTAHWGSWTPGRTALRFEGRSISYAELERGVGTVAAGLRALGVAPGDRVAYLGPNCPELLEVFFASARLGAIFVPLNARMPAAELRVFVEQCRPRLLVAERSLQDVARDSAPQLPRDRVLPIDVGEGTLEAGAGARRPLPTDPMLPAATPVLIAFTSGTTGRPKGATFTHENLTFNSLNAIMGFGMTSTDEVLTALPMFHVAGLLLQTTPAICAGATVTVHRQFDPGLVLEDVQRFRVSLLVVVPAMTSALTAHPAWAAADLRSLRTVATGGTFIQNHAIEPWQQRGVPIVQGYGLTETGPCVTLVPVAEAATSAARAGKPFMYQQVRVVDAVATDLPAGERGEVWIRGRGIMNGYWENPEATRQAIQDGWFRSGDLGFLDGDGHLHIVDRLKDIIIVGSSNVHPSDLEAVLSDCPDIREAAVVGRPDDELGEVPVACVVPVAGRSLTEESVMALFEGRLAAYKHPREVRFLDSLPRNALGKVQRTGLRLLVRDQLPDPAGDLVEDGVAQPA